MASSSDSSLPLSTMVHMITVKLSSSNYLLWYAQISPLLDSQKFLPFIDGTSPPPPKTLAAGDNPAAPNPDFIAWTEKDQFIKLFVVSTLTEEVMPAVLGCPTSRDVWTALYAAFGRGELSFKDDSLSNKKGGPRRGRTPSRGRAASVRGCADTLGRGLRNCITRSQSQANRSAFEFTYSDKSDVISLADKIDSGSRADKSKSSSRAEMDVLEKELSKIVGLDGLKLQLRRWLKGMVLDEKRRALGLKIGPRRPAHMAFFGNPGTGKTSIARLLGKLLHMVGLLPTDKVTEVQRTDLVGQYIGHTGVKTRNKIKEAEGGILFVDEAYRLVVEDLHRDFGKEALDEIMSVMEGGKLVIILAGYSQPMERVISSNAGLQRRIANFFYFDDYSCDELARILHHKMSNGDENSPMYGYMLHRWCSLEAVAAMIRRDTTEEQRTETNGGLVDQMLVKAKENLDWRTDVDCTVTDALLTITLDDLAAGLRFLKEKRKADTGRASVVEGKEEKRRKTETGRASIVGGKEENRGKIESGRALVIEGKEGNRSIRELIVLD